MQNWGEYAEIVENSSLRQGFQLNLTAFQQVLQLKMWNIWVVFQRSVYKIRAEL